MVVAMAASQPSGLRVACVHQLPGEHGAGGADGAVGEVEDAGGAVEHHEAEAGEGVDRAEGEAVDEKEAGGAHQSPPISRR